jgi:hypothetical protein
MQQVNYQEKIVIPTLQKKLQELQASNLVLEVSLLVEQTKVKDIQTYFQSELDSCQSKISSSNEGKNKLNALSDENSRNVQTIERLNG